MDARRTISTMALAALSFGGLAAAPPALAGEAEASPAATAPAPLAFEHLGTWGGPGSGFDKFKAPVAVDAFDGRVYVAELGSHSIETRQGSTGIIYNAIEAPSALLGGFDGPQDVAAADAETFYVADSGNDRVQRFEAGTWKAWGTSGAGQGQFLELIALAVGPNGHVYTVDRGALRIQEFTGAGTFVRSWGGAGDGAGQFNQVVGVAVGPDGSVYTADVGDNRVSRFTSAGRFVSSWTVEWPGGVSTGNLSLDVGVDGKVYVVNLNSKGVFVYSAEGALLGTLGAEVLATPWSVDVDPSGTVRVTDFFHSTVETFRPVLAATTAPKVSGTKKVGKTLKASKGEWPVPGVTLSYRWLRDGKAIGGATKSSYKLKAKDAGRKISVRVTATRADYPAPSSASSAKVKIAKSKPQVTVKLAKTSVTWPAKAKVTARVKVKGVSRPTGKVRVLDGTKRLKTVTLKKSHRGRLTITLPRLKSGKHKIKLQYLGSSQVAKRTSKAKTLTVRR